MKKISLDGVDLEARIQHRNLVRLLGFCLEGNERLLVSEFVPNASLSRSIHICFYSFSSAQKDVERVYAIGLTPILAVVASGDVPATSNRKYLQ
ncbi:unnamed protein product [Prunus brigantina]